MVGEEAVTEAEEEEEEEKEEEEEDEDEEEEKLSCPPAPLWEPVPARRRKNTPDTRTNVNPSSQQDCCT